MNGTYAVACDRTSALPVRAQSASPLWGKICSVLNFFGEQS